MTNIKALIERVKENELIATRFQKVESRILSVLNFKDFFEILLTEIMDTFKMPYVWITLIEDCEATKVILKSSNGSDIVQERVNIISDALFTGLVGSSLAPILVNEELKPYYKMLPENRKYFIKSMAIAPITLDGKIIGSLNQGDSDKGRFDPGFDASLLEQLAIKVSLCLSNVTAHEKLKFLAFHDPLTELLNRRVMESVLKREFYRSKRYSSKLSVIFIDLDDFKSVNDNQGHEAGDYLLRYVADKLVDMTRETDIVARFAGDEFVVILPETGVKKANRLLGRIQKYFIQNPMDYMGNKIPVSISFGAASTQDETIINPAILLQKADQILYKVKKASKDDVKQGKNGLRLAGD
ncbi:MAG: sensor domain-containing diguanylate cyclase [Proteobacteria bacterium]|nr:sensor domain-containing diguanylate cyclase [Pseudomonadota bacterium]